MPEVRNLLTDCKFLVTFRLQIGEDFRIDNFLAILEGGKPCKTL